MADLMTATYDYSSLQKKYKGFAVPAAKVVIGGTDLMAMKEAHVTSLEVVLSIEGAGSARVVLGNCYDYKNGSFQAKLKNLAVLGKTVEVSLGYGSSLLTVFKGFLFSTGMVLDAEEGISFEIMALDVRRLMMSDNFHAAEHSIKNYSDAVTTIMKRYQKLCTAKIENTSENFQDGVIRQNASDYDFIVRDLIGSGLVEREFFVVADKAYFRKPRSVSSVLLTLGIGKGLIRFSRNAEYENQKFLVCGFDPVSGKAVEGSAVSKATDSLTDALGGAGERIIMDPACISSAQAGNMAKNLAAIALAKRQRAEGSCVGLPEIIPGRFLKLERVDSQMNQKYYVTRVTHTYDEDGFLTAFETEGWE